MCIITFLLLSLPSLAITSPLLVNTTGGTIEGYVKGKVRYFDGVPFAAPPIGDLRWRPPQAVTPWKGVRPAHKLPPFCENILDLLPFLLPVDEDCLYLNVITPAELPAKPMPVQLWIHGGGMKVGGSRQPLYRGNHVVEFTIAAMEEPVVIVTTNYRLDVFAMMVQKDLVAEQKGGPLNYGLQDMCFAMKWVQDNIAAFGGDPGRVMLYGESGGGQAVTLQLFANSNVPGCGSFAAAVGESVCNAYVAQNGPSQNVPANPSYIGDMTTNLARGDKFTKALGCSGKSVDCLRKASARQVRTASLGINFNVVVDGVIIPDWPGKLLKSGRFHKKPVIMGSNTNEGQIFALARPRTVQELAHQIKTTFFPWASDAVVARIANYYAGKYPANKTYHLANQEFVNDVILKCTNLAVAFRYAAEGVPSFIYEFGYSYNDGMRTGVASHGAELSFVWGDSHFALNPGSPIPPTKFTMKEQRLANQTMAYWAAFAATHNPNTASPPPGSANWPAVSLKAVYNNSMGINIDDKLGVLPTTLDGCVLLSELGLFPITHPLVAAEPPSPPPPTHTEVIV